MNRKFFNYREQDYVVTCCRLLFFPIHFDEVRDARGNTDSKNTTSYTSIWLVILFISSTFLQKRGFLFHINSLSFLFNFREWKKLLISPDKRRHCITKTSISSQKGKKEKHLSFRCFSFHFISRYLVTLSSSFFVSVDICIYTYMPTIY